MSTSSTTMSGVTHTPSASYGHSRRPARGHNRSGNWTQIPSAVTIPPPHEHVLQGELHEHDHDDSHDHLGHNNGHNNGHIHRHSAEHQHTHSHTHSYSISGNGPIGITKEEEPPDVLLGGPKASAAYATPFQSTTDSYVPLSYEIVTGFFAALPWIVLSWYMRPYTSPTSHRLYRLLKSAAAKQSFFKTYSPETTVDTVWWRTLLLSSATMVAIGALSLLRRQRAGQALPSMANFQASWATGQTALVRIASIGLPIYAGMVVGGPMVALAFTLTYAAGLPSIFDGTVKSGKGERLGQKKASLFIFTLYIILNMVGCDSPVDTHPFRGYVALFISIFVLRPPFATLRDAGPAVSQLKIASVSSGVASLLDQQLSSLLPSTLIASPEDIQLTILSGGFLGLLSLLLAPFSGAKLSFGFTNLLSTALTAIFFAASLTFSTPSGLRSRHKIGHVTASILIVFAGARPHVESSRIAHLTWLGVAVLSYFAAVFDDSKPSESSHKPREMSQLSKLLLQYGEPYPILHSILMEDDSRRIFYFMILNFAFMLIQLTYGFLTGSLGLLSDSIHMFFDCLALVVGLSAAVMSKWPPSARFPYGYGKVDTLSGFANGVFLMIISVEIVYEAIERLMSGSQMHRIQELLIVSLAGLAVNLVGIMAFDHAHHGHGHDHGHDHGNENMHGIFLHILADTLGSVAVVISTILVHFYGWSGYDPIASCLIAILIFASAVPLVRSTAQALLLTLPADVEYNLRDTLAGVSTLRGVVGYTVPKFWLDDTASSTAHDHGHGHAHSGSRHHHHGHSHNHDHSHSHSHEHEHDHDHDHNHGHSHSHEHENSRHILGIIHIIASRTADLEDVRRRTVDFLRDKNMDIVVQVEREGGDNNNLTVGGSGRGCWCGNGTRINSPHIS